MLPRHRKGPYASHAPSPTPMHHTNPFCSMEEQSAGDEVPAESALSLASVCASYAFAPAPGDLISPADWLGSPHLLAAASYPGALRVAGGGGGLTFTRLSCEQQLRVFAAYLDKNGEVRARLPAVPSRRRTSWCVFVSFFLSFPSPFRAISLDRANTGRRAAESTPGYCGRYECGGAGPV